MFLSCSFLIITVFFLCFDQKTVPVIFDTLASLAITHSIEDFVKPPKALDRPLFLGGMADGFEVSGIGKFSGHLKHVINQKFRSSCMATMSQMARLDFSDLNEFSINNRESVDNPPKFLPDDCFNAE